MDPALEQEIVSILDEANDLTIATVRENGYPQATTVSYVNEGLTIYFGCAAQSQKAKNIGHSAKVSLTVNLPYASWDEIRGLSVGGKAAAVTDPKEMDRVGQMMLRKFPQIARYAPTDLEQLVVLRITPEIIPVLDYRKEFGHTDLVKVVFKGIGARGALPSILMAEQKTQSRDPGVESRTPPFEQHGGLPAVIEQAPPRADRRRRSRLVLLVSLLIIGAGAGIGWSWWQHYQARLPLGIASGNGRLEADEIDIDTKFAGRIAKLFADEGDMVTAGQLVALMDTRDLEASLKKSEALVSQAQRALDEAEANLAQQQTQVTLAQQQLDRTSALAPKGFATVELLDQRRQQMNGAVAAQNAANHKVAEAQHALDAATHDVELYRVNIVDNALVAPREGRIQYRVANVGEVLPAGGKVFTMLDTSYVYMDVYLPTAEAGRIRPGSDARIVLDAYPAHAIPAKVVFIASQAQFTPKTVETKDERDKLMFRIRLRIDPERLRGRAEIVRSGLPGVAYLRTDPAVAWPPQLQGDAPS